MSSRFMVWAMREPVHDLVRVAPGPNTLLMLLCAGQVEGSLLPHAGCGLDREYSERLLERGIADERDTDERQGTKELLARVSTDAKLLRELARSRANHDALARNPAVPAWDAVRYARDEDSLEMALARLDVLESALCGKAAAKPWHAVLRFRLLAAHRGLTAAAARVLLDRMPFVVLPVLEKRDDLVDLMLRSEQGQAPELAAVELVDWIVRFAAKPRPKGQTNAAARLLEQLAAKPDVHRLGRPAPVLRARFGTAGEQAGKSDAVPAGAGPGPAADAGGPAPAEPLHSSSKLMPAQQVPAEQVPAELLASAPMWRTLNEGNWAALGRLLGERYGDDPRAWSAALALSGSWELSVGELVEAVAGVLAEPDPDPEAPRLL